MARAVRRAKRDIQTVTGTWNATTSPVLITKTTAAHTGEACNPVTSTSGSATSGILRQNTKMTFAASTRRIGGTAVRRARRVGPLSREVLSREVLSRAAAGGGALART